MYCPTGQQIVGIGAGGQFWAEAPTADWTGVTVMGRAFAQNGGAISVTLLCTPASALSGVITTMTVDHRAATSAYQWLTDTAKCPAGYYAFAGAGYYTTGASSVPQNAGQVTGSDLVGDAPTTDGNGWSVTSLAPDDGRQAVTIARCAPRTGREYLSRAWSAVSTDSWGPNVSVYAECSDGGVPISGGAQEVTGTSFAQYYPVLGHPYPDIYWSTGSPFVMHDSRPSWFGETWGQHVNTRLVTSAVCVGS